MIFDDDDDDDDDDSYLRRRKRLKLTVNSFCLSSFTRLRITGASSGFNLDYTLLKIVKL